MKVHQTILLYLCIVLVFTVNLNSKHRTLSMISLKNQRYGYILESAIQDAAENLVIRDKGCMPIIQRDEAVQVLFHSLYAGFGVMHDATAKQEILSCIPLILIADIDGFYFYYLGKYEENGKNLGYVWSEKMPYGTYLTPKIDKTYSSGAYENTKSYYLGLTLGDALYAMEEGNNEICYQTYADLALRYPNVAVFKSEEVYREFQRKIIIDTITEAMNQYINQSNRIAKRYHMTYEFTIPYLDDSDWGRTIRDISILILFQGYPYGNKITETYNQVKIAGARVQKKRYYYISKIDGTLFYHKRDCKYWKEDLTPYETKRECALLGAYPCPDCIP